MASREINEVVVTDIKMSFSSMVIFMVKWAIATIPAIIILTVVGSITWGILTALFGGFHQRMTF
jgi:CHASE2 domain-containing sensor protein